MNKEYTVYFEGKMTVIAETKKEAEQTANERLYDERDSDVELIDFNIKTVEEGECAECGGTGEVATDEDDGEGHIMRGVGTKKCICKM